MNSLILICEKMMSENIAFFAKLFEVWSFLQDFVKNPKCCGINFLQCTL